MASGRGVSTNLLAWIGGMAVVAVAVVVIATQTGAPSYPPVDPARVAALAAPSSAPATSAAVGSALVAHRTPGRPLRALFVGDALTIGASASADDRSFRALATAAWSGGGAVTDDVVAKAGATTADIAARLPPDPAADLVVVEIGTFDATTSTPADVGTAYSRLLDTLRTAAPDAPLVCLGAWLDASRAAPIDAAIGASCGAHAGRFVDLSGLYGDLADHVSPTNLLPNDAGHAAIARRLLAQVRVA